MLNRCAGLALPLFLAILVPSAACRRAVEREARPSATQSRAELLVWSLDPFEPREPTGPADLVDRLRRGRRLLDELARAPTAETALRAARFQALHDDLESAGETLRKALERQPDAAELWADLGAALYAGAGPDPRRAEGLLAALEAMARAGDAGGAPCNQAVLFDELGLAHGVVRRAEQCRSPGESIVRARFAAASRVRSGSRGAEDWFVSGRSNPQPSLSLEDLVRRLDANSQPAAEAWRALLELRPRRGDLALRELGGELTPELANELALVYAAKTGNSQVRRLAQEAADLRERSEFVEMLDNWRQASLLLLEFKPGAARERLLRARAAAQRRNSTLLPSIQLALATADYLSGRLSASETTLRGLRDRYPRSEFPAIWARSLWMEALIRQGEGDWDGALPNLLEARALFDELLESAHSAWIQVLEGMSLGRLGRHEEAAANLVAAIRSLASHGDTRALSGALILLAEQQEARGRRRAAVELLEESAAWDRLDGSPVLIADSLSTLGATLVRQGRAKEAMAHLNKARAVLAEFDDAEGRVRVEALGSLAEAAAQVDDDPEVAVRLATVMLERFESLGELHFAIEGRRVRGRAFRNAGERDLAQRDFEAAVAESMRQHERVEDPREAADFVDLARAALEDLVDVTVLARGGAMQALAWVESIRWQQLGRGRTTPEELERRLADLEPREGVCFSTQFATAKALHAWSRCGSQEWAYSSSPLDRERLRFELLSYAAGRHELSWAALASRGQQFQALLPAEVRKCGTVSVQWIVAADEILSPILWSWLPDPCSERPLGDRIAIGSTPALSGLLARRRDNAESAPRLLALGTGTPQEIPGLSLPALRFARAEAAAAARAVDAATVLADEAIAPSEIVRRLAVSDTLHLVGHFARIDDSGSPASAFLAGAADASRPLTARSLLTMGGSRLRLAFLSGCSSGEGPRRAVAGSEDFATELLLGGVREVVATRWDLQDLDYSSFITSFYEQYDRSRSAVDALWQAHKAAGAFTSDEPAARALRAFEVVTSQFEEGGR